MPETTARLALPIMAPAQAQKHVTHNEALLLLDGATQLVLDGIGTETPPPSPALGETHFVGPSPTGIWVMQPGALAQWQGDQWIFQAPRLGWRGWDAATDTLMVFDGSAWQSSLRNVDGLGIATDFDATNRLALSSPASLFSHAGAGHQLKVNKASDGDTAALLFQSDWSGHAELGLAGDTNFRLKVSADGINWTEALIVDPASGHISGAAVQTTGTDVTHGKLARADFAFGPGNLLGSVSEAAGVPTGAVIERGSNAQGDYVRFADGTQICTATVTTDVNLAIGGLFWSGAVTHDFPVPFAVTPAGSGAMQSDPAGWVNGRADGATAWSFSAFGTTSATDESVSLIAIGRWF